MDTTDRTTRTPLRDRIFRKTQPWMTPAPDLAARTRSAALACLADDFAGLGVLTGRDDDALLITWHGPDDRPRTIRLTVQAEAVTR